MSTVAAGAYLQTLRTSAGLSQKDVAKLLKTSDSQIDRIERGQTNTRGTVWFQVAEILAANLYELSQLLTDTSASKEDGIALANQWLELTPVARQEYQRLLKSSNGRAKLVRSMAKVADDPVLRAQAQGCLDRLADEHRQ